MANALAIGTTTWPIVESLNPHMGPLYSIPVTVTCEFPGFHLVTNSPLIKSLWILTLEAPSLGGGTSPLPVAEYCIPVNFIRFFWNY